MRQELNKERVRGLRVAALVLAMALPVSSMAAAVVIEAENFTAQGGGSATKPTDRPATSGGVALAGWDSADHWFEWKFEVPESADYTLTMRYAGGRGWTVWREVQIDGKVPAPGFEKVSLPATGGFGRKAEEWSNLAVGVDGKPVTVKLEKGAHTLRIKNLGGAGASGSANFDAIVFTSGDTTAASALKL